MLTDLYYLNGIGDVPNKKMPGGEKLWLENLNVMIVVVPVNSNEAIGKSM